MPNIKEMKNRSANFGIIIPIIVAMFNIFLILHPTQMIAAAKDGLLMWFNQVLPTLLPFVVGANLLAGLGFIHFMGALMAPVMVPVFKVPGVGAFALLTGFCSGYPMGAKAVAHLRETRQISRGEAQRLMAFTNNAGPLFVVGFVGAGLLGSVHLGFLLLASHISAAIIVGLLVRVIFSDDEVSGSKGGVRQAFLEFREFRAANNQGFGSVLGVSVKNAMDSMVLIGGFIVLFCVVIEVFEVIGVFRQDGDLLTGFAAGLLEVANGAKMIAGGGPPNAQALAVISGVISFGGFSVHGQTAHFLRGTDVKFAPYLGAKAVQGVISGAICLLVAL